VRRPEDGAPRRLVDAAGLHAHEPVLHHVHAPDAVGAGHRVEVVEQDGRAHRPAVDGHGVALLEIDLDVGRLVGGLLGRDGDREDVLRRLVPGILQDAALVGDVQGVAVRAVGLVLRDGKRDAVLGRVVDHVLPRRERPLVVAPGGDDPDVGVEGHVGELEAHLVVALARGAVAHGVGLLAVGDLDLPLGDQRPRDRGAHQVGALVDGVGPQHGEHEVPDELLAQVLDIALAGPRPDGLLLEAVELLLLAHVGGKGDDLAAGVGLQEPPDDDRRIQAARVGDHHFFHRF